MTMAFPRSLRAPLAAVPCAAALVVGVGAPGALAHDAVIGGSPADGEVVTEFPDTLELTFSGEVQDGFNTFALSNARTGQVIYTGEPELEGRTVSLALPADLDTEPGDYRIGFQIISSDGHSTKGMTSFTYQSADAGTASETAAPDPAGGDGGASSSTDLTLLWAGLGVLVVAGAAIAVIGKQKKRRELDS